MAETAALGAVVTPTVLFECIDQLKKCAFSIPSDRHIIALRLADEIIDMGKKDSGETVLKFSNDLSTVLVQIVENTASCSKFTTRKQRMWREFHKSRCSTLKELWTDFFKCLGIDHQSDSLLMQNVFEECFNYILKKKFESSENVSESSELRYVAGYIPHNLRKKILNGTHIFKESFLECLSQMGVKGGEENLDTDGSSFQDFTKKWIQKINRGGLFLIKDEVYVFFFELERKLRQYLPKLLTKKCCKQTIIDEILDDDNVQFQWCLISTVVEDATASQELLGMIVELWLTIRGFSHAAAYLEFYKQQTKVTIKKATGLRKGLKRKHVENVDGFIDN